MNTKHHNIAPVMGRPATEIKSVATHEKPPDILLHADGVELDEKLRGIVSRNISRLRRFAPWALRARVQLHKTRATPSPRQFCARVHYEVPGNDLIVEHYAHDPITAFTLVTKKLKGRLRRRKTARLANRVRAVRAGAARLNCAAARQEPELLWLAGQER